MSVFKERLAQAITSLSPFSATVIRLGENTPENLRTSNGVAHILGEDEIFVENGATAHFNVGDTIISANDGRKGVHVHSGSDEIYVNKFESCPLPNVKGAQVEHLGRKTLTKYFEEKQQ